MPTLQAHYSRWLTRQETKSTFHVANGLSNQEIGERLGICERTAKYHVENAMHKLDADNRAHMITEAFRHGILKFLCVTLMMLSVGITLTNADTDIRVSRGGLKTSRATRPIRNRRREAFGEPLELIAAV